MFHDVSTTGPCADVFGARWASSAEQQDSKLDELHQSYPRLVQTIRSAGITSYDGFVESVKNTGFLKQQAWKWLKQLQYHTVSRFHLATQGGVAENIALYSYDKTEEGERVLSPDQRRLFDGYRAGDVIVLNFGSLTCPIWCRASASIAKLERRFSNVFFRHIYISEAHPKGWWETVPRPEAERTDNEGLCFPDPKTVVERAMMVDRYLAHEGSPLREGSFSIDSMENQARECYQAWPIRLYVVVMETRDSTLVPRILFQGEMGPMGFDPMAVCSALEVHRLQASLPE